MYCVSQSRNQAQIKGENFTCVPGLVLLIKRILILGATFFSGGTGSPL